MSWIKNITFSHSIKKKNKHLHICVTMYEYNNAVCCLFWVTDADTSEGKWLLLKGEFYFVLFVFYFFTASCLSVAVCMGACLLKKHKSHIVMGVRGRNWETPYGAPSVSCRGAKCRVSEHSLLPAHTHTHTHTQWDVHTDARQLREKTSGLMTLCVRSTLETL